MRNICWLTTLCVLMSSAILPAAVPLLADETETIDPQDQQTHQKDECLLAARRCGNSAISIQDKIERLKEEIDKGRAVYTLEELNTLQQKLDEVNRTLDFLLEK